MKVTGLKLPTEPFYCFCKNYRVVEKLLNRHEFICTVYPVIRVGMLNAEGDTALDPVYISSSADSYTFAFFAGMLFVYIKKRLYKKAVGRGIMSVCSCKLRY